MEHDDHPPGTDTASAHANRTPLLALGGIIIALVAAVLIVPSLTSTDDTPAVPTNQTPQPKNDWVRANIYNGATGQGIAIDRDGTVTDRYDKMGRFIDSRVVARSRSLAFLPRENTTNADGTTNNDKQRSIEIGPVPLNEDTSTNYSLPIGPTAEVAVLAVPDRLVFAVHEPDGGNITIVDADNRRSLDLAKLLNVTEPTFTLSQLQLEPSGEQFAVYDDATNETAVVSFSRPRPRYYKNRALAISSDRIVTSRTEGLASTNTVYAPDGSIVVTFTSDPVTSATMDGHTTYLITNKDDVLRLLDGSTEPTVLARVPDAKRVALAQDGDRLIVDSPWGFAVLNVSGDELGQLRPGAGGVENPSRASRCLAADVNELITRTDTNNSVKRGPAVFKLNELQLTPVTGLPIHSSTNQGCTVATEIGDTETYQLISADGSLSLNENGDIPVVGPYRRMFLSPNPNQWIAMLPDKSIALFELADGQVNQITAIPFPEADYITVSFTPAAPTS